MASEGTRLALLWRLTALYYAQFMLLNVSNKNDFSKVLMDECPHLIPHSEWVSKDDSKQPGLGEYCE